MNSKARACCGNKCRAPEADEPLRIVQRHVEIVVDLCTLTLGDHICGYAFGHPEQHEGLVDHVRAEIVQYAAARLRNLAPPLLDLRTEAVPMRLEQRDLAKRRQHLLHGQEI